MSEAQAAEEIEEIALPARRDRPVTLLHRLELAIVVLLTGLFRLLGVDAASALAGNFMRHVGPMIRPVSRKAERNMARIYPDWSEETDTRHRQGCMGKCRAHRRGVSASETLAPIRDERPDRDGRQGKA